MYTYTTRRHIKVPQNVAWSVISDLDRYAEYAPNLSLSRVISGEGVGLVRRCADSRGGEWNEQCVLWEEGQRYSIRVDTTDYPYPFTYFQGTWAVEPNGVGVNVTMSFDFQPEKDPPIIGWFINKVMMRPMFNRVAGKLLDNWQAAMLERT